MKKQARIPDVCLLLEGTYPFVSGGVSTWLHNLVCGLPELTFTAVCILPTSKEEWKHRYQVPDNFKVDSIIYLHDQVEPSKSMFARMTKAKIEAMRVLHQRYRNRDYSGVGGAVRAFQDNQYPMFDLVHGKQAFDLLVELYGPDENDDSFLDYFWTYRFTHLPMFKVLGVKLPRARVYHTISTGYAGLMGAMARLMYKRPLLLTEHGIYVKERKIEISQAEWIYVAGDRRLRVERKLGRFQTMWTAIFESLGRLTYHHAERIFTLYEGNRQMEIAEGADPDKCEIIPNGINIGRFRCLKPDDPVPDEQDSYAIGFVGRVVPIKDVKTFIRACKIVAMRLGKVKAYIMGPFEEDKEYFAECKALVELMGLEEVVEFTGKVKVMDYYPRLDVIVLTSISEAQPLVVMEANCAGIPAVATDVGSCRELLEGRTDEDKALGPSGVVTKVADPVDTAKGILRVLGNQAQRRQMAVAGRERIDRYYRESDLVQRYLEVYRQYMAAPDLEEGA